MIHELCSHYNSLYATTGSTNFHRWSNTLVDTPATVSRTLLFSRSLLVGIAVKPALALIYLHEGLFVVKHGRHIGFPTITCTDCAAIFLQPSVCTYRVSPNIYKEKNNVRIRVITARKPTSDLYCRRFGKVRWRTMMSRNHTHVGQWWSSRARHTCSTKIQKTVITFSQRL